MCLVCRHVENVEKHLSLPDCFFVKRFICQPSLTPLIVLIAVTIKSTGRTAS